MATTKVVLLVVHKAGSEVTVDVVDMVHIVDLVDYRVYKWLRIYPSRE